jgi:hypothetical protein
LAFLKFSCDGAYATGAVRTSLDPKGFACKLGRHKMPSRLSQGCVEATCGGDRWTFQDWSREGDQWTGWLRFSMIGDLEALSRRLATHGVRHMLEWSAPRDADTDHIRRVTRYSYRWTGLDRSNADRTTPDIEHFEEHLR